LVAGNLCTMSKNAVYKIVMVLLLALVVIRFIKPGSSANKYQQTTEKPAKRTESTGTNKDVSNTSIDELTSEAVVVAYVKQHKQLPNYYITKKEARKNGWNAAEGNLCDVLPGRAIGGDVFTNRERQLPYSPGRVWYEADLNYNCAHRNADRLLFSNDGLVFVTKDHYKTFVQQ
jgi:hypothetical protein